MKKRCVVVRDRMQDNYVYYLTEPAGRNFDDAFTPDLTPSQMLALGVFGGKYMTDCSAEFPASWLKKPGSHPCDTRLRSTSSAFVLRNRWRSGAKKAGSGRMIRVAGSSGIAVTTWAGAAPMMRVRSVAGGPCADT